MIKQYTTESIQVLKGLEPVRRMPGMYTDTRRPNHLVQEVVDNCVDEALAGFASNIAISLNKDGSIYVQDNGRGLPVDIHLQHKVSGVELVLTTLHAGSKFDNEIYGISGGLHGVGVSVVNALSEWLEVEVRQNGYTHFQRYESGVPLQPLERSSKVLKSDTGTNIRFKPDPQFFDSVNLDLEHLTHLLRAKAILCHGLTINLEYFEADELKSQIWTYENGISGYLLEHLPTERVPDQPFLVDNQNGHNEAVEFAMSWNKDTDPLIESYVNLVPTSLGGTHVNGLRSGVTEALREFCDFRNLLPKGVKLTAEDVMKQCSFVLSAKLENPQFSGQTKERLSSHSATTHISGVAKDAFTLWLNQHTQDGEEIAQLAITCALKRMQSSKKIRRKTYSTGPTLPGKLADCASQSVTETELFLVEGDSAGGTAKQARDREFQAVLPLRGKILNTWEVDSNAVLSSQTVADIAQSIGVEPGSEDISRLRYHKVCILADADSDGAHIATLLCALFLKHFPLLVAKGHIYIALPPLYRVDVGKEVFYVLDEIEKNDLLARLARRKNKSDPVVQRFKGLGEMNPLQLRETTMSPETRKLMCLTVHEARLTHNTLDMLLAKKRSPDRRQWLEKRGDQAILTRIEPQANGSRQELGSPSTVL